MKMYEVAVAAPLRKTLTYGEPAEAVADREVVPGQRVLVPLGRRKVTGYVLGRADKEQVPDDPSRIKPIAELLDATPLFPENLIPFFRWIADYYHYPLGEVIRTALPGGLTAGSARRIELTAVGEKEIPRSSDRSEMDAEKWLDRLLGDRELTPSTVAGLWRKPAFRKCFGQWEKKGWITITEEVLRKPLQEKKEIRVTLLPEMASIMSGAAGLSEDNLTEMLSAACPDLKVSERKTLAIMKELLNREGDAPILQPDITRQYSSGGRALRTLEEKNIVTREEVRVYRDPLGNQAMLFPRPEHLTIEQEAVLTQLLEAVTKSSFQPFLLHGITGCGKTEVYLRSAEEVLRQGKSVLVLVPEIALASQLEAHFYCRFGNRLALLHSGLSPAERHDQWQRIAAGEARVVIGARSAVFAPLGNPGLVIVDEEHEPAYKQDDGLRYHGRDVAVLRARFNDCPVILGSATPSVVSFHHARTGKYTLLTMTKRIHDQSLPEVRIVDLGKDRSSRPDLLFSDQLISALWETMEQRRQSLLFVNRRGFASFMMCQDCGHIVQCRNCQVSLTLHQHSRRLICHYCGYSLTTKIVCPNCSSAKVKGMGLGSERIEQEVRQLIPHARVARLDSDTVTSRTQYQQTLRAINQGEVDILVGTQMIAKGLHFPNMTLVGVVWADSGLGMPDFRAAERTFQLLAQVTGRAGRGEHPGQVIIQTYQPHHYAVQYARQHDYDGFYGREVGLRSELSYPPFARMVNIRINGADEVEVKKCAERTASFLREELGRRGWQDVDILGPAPAPLARIKNKTRWQLMLKSSQVNRLHVLCEVLLGAAGRMSQAGVNLGLDVDPENMM